MNQTISNDLSGRLTPGAKVKVTQQIVARHYSMPTVVSGSVVRYEQRPTGSWYAHSKNDKLWLDRLVLRREDGELMSLSLDEFSEVEVIGAA